MFEEYKKDLLKFYRIKKENHRLPDNLAPLGRERLRTACIEKFEQNNAQKDKELMRAVFGPTDEHEDQMRTIERFDLDRFRPLISFLTIEGRNIRDDKLVKLFAWLIAFPPNEEWREFSQEEKNRVFKAAEKERHTPPVPPPPPPRPSVIVPRFSAPQIIIFCIILLFIGSTSFFVWERSLNSIRRPNTDEKFMYWDGDHYEPVKAGEQEPGVTIIPLDLKKLNQQKKINLPDTMTKYSLGKVWYKGRGKGHEFFTDSGIYPPDTSRSLLPLSSTILKYSSYDRYLLNRLKWFLCAAFLISLSGYGVSRLKKEIKQPVEEEEKDHIRNISKIELA